MIHLDLFSGIGGFSLAADRVWPGIEHVFVEIDPFCQAILKKHWPNSKVYGDIKKMEWLAPDTGLCAGCSKQKLESKERAKEHEGSIERPFLVTGGFPCQPFSQAGRRKGTSDDRYLWPEMFAVIGRTLPEWVVAENVRGLLTWSDGLVLEKCCADLESVGYEVQPVVVPACAVGAPHRRDRVWIVAHAERERRGAERRDVQETNGRPSRQLPIAGSASSHAPDTRQEHGRAWGSEEANQDATERGNEANFIERRSETWNEDWPEVATRFCALDDGLPDGLPRPRGWRNAALKACGNAIVPEVAVRIMEAIRSA